LQLFSFQVHADWVYSNKTDTFTDEVTYMAQVSEPTYSFYHLYGIGTFKLGLRCDKAGGATTPLYATFQVGQVISSFSTPITFHIKVGEKKFKLNGSMYSNSMESGWARVHDSIRTDLLSALSRGSNVQFRIDPDYGGELDGTSLSLTGSATAIAKIQQQCKN
jgi:hypothetical protein